MKVEWGRRASQDVHRIWMFLARQDVGYAERVEARLNEAAQLIGKVPRIGRPGVTPGTRIWSVVDTQHFIEYQVEESRVLILHVRSTREDRQA